MSSQNFFIFVSEMSLLQHECYRSFQYIFIISIFDVKPTTHSIDLQDTLSYLMFLPHSPNLQILHSRTIQVSSIHIHNPSIFFSHAQSEIRVSSFHAPIQTEVWVYLWQTPKKYKSLTLFSLSICTTNQLNKSSVLLLCWFLLS